MLLRVNWTLLNECNFKCSYCYNTNKNKSFKLNSIIVKKVLDNILNLNYSEFEFVLTGGEPTSLSNLKELISQIYLIFGEKLKSINFITNFSKDFIYFKDILNQFDSRLSIRVSCHLKYYDSSFFNKLSNVLKLNKKIYLSIILDKNYYNKILEVICETNKLLKIYNNIYPSLRYVFQDTYDQNEKTLFNFINKLWGVDSLIYNKNIQYGNYCISGLNLLIIMADLSFSGSYCKQTKIINVPFIFYSPDDIKKKIISVDRCRMSCCDIPTNFLLPKFKKKEDANTFLKNRI